jgi:vacuolar-type H+-ATPase subunit I/STV1
MFLHKEKTLYTNLNKLKKGEKLYTGYGWVPKTDMPHLLSEIEGIK